MNTAALVLAIRAAGFAQLVTLASACLTPIPRGWDEGLRQLSAVHRRFALAQNLFIGGVMAYLGLTCVLLAPELAAGGPSARALAGAVALWWGGRFFTLPWLRVGSELRSPALRIAFIVLNADCAVLGLAFGWLALRI